MTVKRVLIECCYWCPNCEQREYSENDGDDLHYFCEELGERIEDEDSFLPNCPWEDELSVKYVKDLTEPEQKVLARAKAILKKVEKRSGYWIQVTKGLDKDGTLGQQDRNELRIERSQLRAMKSAVSTLLHELVHFETNDSDITREFEAGLTDMCGRLAMLIK